MKIEELYLLVYRVNNEESLVLAKDGQKVGLVTFLSLQEAKDFFKDSYKVLTDLPPTNMPLFSEYFEQIALTTPVVIKLNAQDALRMISEWRLDDQIMTYDAPFLPPNTFFARMKKGFIDRFIVLDIVKDIESITCVGPDGRIIVHKINITNGLDGSEPAPTPLTEKEAKEILRQRGFR